MFLYRNGTYDFVWISVFVLTFYNIYRYPLQINFSGTSPTYSDTPVSFSAVKYIYAFISVGFLLFFKKFSTLKFDVKLIFFFCFFIFLYTAFKALAFADLAYIGTTFWMAVALFFSVYVRDISYIRIDAWLRRLFYFSLIINLFQFFNFLIFDRLPALAYAGTLSIRFGSFLDDPNGFAAICFLLLGWSLQKSGWPKLFYSLCIAIMIIMTQSLTAYLLFIIFLIGYFLIFIKNTILIFFASIIVLLFLAIFRFNNIIYDFFEGIYLLKEASILEHQSSAVFNVMSLSIGEFLFGNSFFGFSESWWVQSLSSFGVLWLISFILLFGYLFYRAVIACMLFRFHNKFPIYFGIFSFALFVFLGSFNLPFFSIFPINFLLFFMLFLVIEEKII